MKFKSGQRRRALEYEKDWVERWKKEKTFEKSVEQRPADNAFVFYDGPPFITGVPHHGTLLSSIVKDVIPRYQTMKGKRVERVWGWDCHGLPAENFTEKHLNGTVSRKAGCCSSDLMLKSGDETRDISLEEYVTTARSLMVANSEIWEKYVDRIGRWVDFRGAYNTMDKDFMESVWWAFKQLYEAGKIYEGEKVLMYDTKFATPVSKNEVTMDNDAYQTVTDPSVYVKFKLRDDVEAIKDTLQKVWQKDTCYSNLVDQWSEQNKSVGQCSISALIVNDLLGGEIAKIKVDGMSHYFNIVNDEVLDLTSEQFGKKKVDYSNREIKDRQTILDNKNTLERYELLKKRFSQDHQTKYLLAWTTTPWTLPGNTALAVNPEMNYSEVRIDDEILIMAKDLRDKVLIDDKKKPFEYEVVRDILPGSQLVGKSYEPTSAFLSDDDLVKGLKFSSKDNVWKNKFISRGKAVQANGKWVLENKRKIWAADFVSAENGTGIVHIAPAYGEDDFALAQENGIPVQHAIDDNGYYFPEFATELYKLMPWRDSAEPLEVWDANKDIAKGLKKVDIVWKIEYIEHEYPFNPRSKQRIMYRAIPSWFFDIQNSKPLMLEQNENINWFPPHLKHGRFAKNIEQAPDWNLSRDRFWATAMPVWKGDKGTVKVVGSYDELYELSGKRLDDYHRPWVDEITFEIDGEKFTRIDKVLDCWFESGSMPFAQIHYPFENQEKFEKNYPGDFIAEYMPQVRAWFYYLHTINTTLAEVGAFGDSAKKQAKKNAFKNVIVTGTVAGNDGFKMSKSRGNYTDPNELMDEYSADSLRFLLMSSPLLNGEDFALKDKDVSDVARKLSMIWNMYDFFTMYAEVDGWEYQPEAMELSSLKNPLDIWIVSRYRQLRDHITKYMDEYNLPDAMSEILPFVDDASNWFVRRSRRRFWKSEDDADKNDAYRTLHYILRHLSYVLAPFTPFLAEELHRNLTGGESVHLLDWPKEGEIDETELERMSIVRQLINEGLSQRAESGVKVRQPLGGVKITWPRIFDYEGQDYDMVSAYRLILLDELNVKGVVEYEYGDEPTIVLDLEITPELKREGQSREVIRFVQNARKQAGLNVDDRIKLLLTTDDAELQQAIDEYRETIANETLAVEFAANDGFETTVKIDNIGMTIQLRKEDSK